MPRKSQNPASGHTILVVDDQEEVLVSVRQLLEREGHHVLTADSGERALDLFKENEVHLILVDYFMPRMTGEEVIREIRRFDPYVQIILQTGYAGDKPARRMMSELEIQGYHDKADGPDKLLLWVDVGLKAHGLVSQVRERERLQGELVANVSHEFRTPLNIIGGYTDLLLDRGFGTLPKATLTPLKSIRQAASNLADLVSDFLAYAKAEAGTLRVAHQRVEPEELAYELERLGTFLLEGRGVVFHTNIEEAPASFYSDPVKLRTILRNLVINAAKFTHEGTILLHAVREGAGVRFTVTDTGPGIPQDQLKVIFEPFRQVDGSATRQHGGIGLGLALSRKLACILGGNLEVESKVGSGSAFTLTLPAAVAEPDATPVSPPLQSEEESIPAAVGL